MSTQTQAGAIELIVGTSALPPSRCDANQPIEKPA